MASTERASTANKTRVGGEHEELKRQHVDGQVEEIEQLRQRVAELEEMERQHADVLLENGRLRAERDESREQQTATAEVLRAIASSPVALQPVLQSIVEVAARLCDTPDMMLSLVDGGGMRHWAGCGPFASRLGFPSQKADPLDRQFVNHRAVLEARTVHVPEVLAEPEEEYGKAQRNARRTGYRTVLGVPLRRGDAVLGALIAWRFEVRPFTDQQIKLLETFADQAVIAIENTRLFSELQESNRTLQESLDQQTATSEILRVIASSPADLERVLGTIAESVAQFCDSPSVIIFGKEGDRLRIRAAVRHGEDVSREYPDPDGDPIIPGWITGRAVLERRTIHVPDLLDAAQEFPFSYEAAQRRGHRTIASAPLLRQGTPVGAIGLVRLEPRPFTDDQLRRLETFADQAVIAIENVRLFQELQAENERKRQELERASGIQRRLLPSTVPAWPGQLEMAYRFLAAVETSGDFYDVVTAAATTPDDPAPLQIAVADVAGKGMGGALVMSLARAALRYAATSPIALSPAGTARMVSDRLHRDVGSSSFVACALATVEPAGGISRPRLRLVNAGQVPVLLCREGEVTELEPPGDRLPFGAVAGVAYQELLSELRPGDVVVFSSDGLVEAPARREGHELGVKGQEARLRPVIRVGELFGFERLAQSVGYWSGQAKDAEGVAEGIWRDLTSWCGEESHHDDMTLLVLRVP